MISRADITGVRPVGSIESAKPTAPVADLRQETFDRFNQQSIGKLFQAAILSRFSDGSFAVEVADTMLRMDLPSGAQVGDALDLTLVAARPRPTFLLGTPAGEASASLSSTGSLINSVLQAAQKEGAPTALVGKTPLVPSPAASPAEMTTALKNTLAFSGLFYESHVGQWANGERSLADLMREPQAKHGSPLLANSAPRLAAGGANPMLPAAEPGDSNTAGHVANLEQDADTGRAATELARTGHASAGTALLAETSAAISARTGNPATDSSALSASAAEAETAVRAETMSSESVRMISLQLDTLEQRHVAWHGELWPGQTMEWEVTEEAPDRKPDDPEKSWQSAVRFELPTLGPVSATIRLTGERLQVQVRTANEAAASLLRTHGGELSSALEAAGSPLDQLTVKRDESV